MTQQSNEGFPALGVSSAEIALMADTIKMIAEIITGYRTALIAGGFSVTTAEALSQQFHAKLMENIK